ANYEGNQPDLTTVILQSNGFASLLENVNFMARIARQNQQVVTVTRTARAAVSRQATELASLEKRDRVLADQVLAKRNEAAGPEAAVARQQLRQVAARSTTSAKYHSLQGRLEALEKKAARQAAAAAATGNANVAGIAVNTHGMVQPPPGAPATVAQVI